MEPTKLGVLIIILSLFFIINDKGGFWQYSSAIFGVATLVLVKSLNLSVRLFYLGHGNIMVLKR